MQTCVGLVAKADAARQPATLAIGRATIGEWMFNRRPIKPDSTVLSMLNPADPYVLGQGLRFGTVTVIVHDGAIVQVERTEKLRLPRRTDPG